jgi:hypothetical protein
LIIAKIYKPHQDRLKALEHIKISQSNFLAQKKPLNTALHAQKPFKTEDPGILP